MPVALARSLLLSMLRLLFLWISHSKLCSALSRSLSRSYIHAIHSLHASTEYFMLKLNECLCHFSAALLCLCCCCCCCFFIVSGLLYVRLHIRTFFCVFVWTKDICIPFENGLLSFDLKIGTNTHQREKRRMEAKLITSSELIKLGSFRSTFGSKPFFFPFILPRLMHILFDK